MWWDVIVGTFTGHKQNDVDKVEDSRTDVPSPHKVGDRVNMATEETAEPVDQEHSSDTKKGQQGSIDAQKSTDNSSAGKHSRMGDPPAFVLNSPPQPDDTAGRKLDPCSAAEDKQETTPSIEEEMASVVLSEVTTPPTPTEPSSPHQRSITTETQTEGHESHPSEDDKQGSVMKEEVASATDATAQATEPSSEPPTTPLSRTRMIVGTNEKQVDSSLNEDVGSAVATDITAQATEPSTPSSRNKRHVLHDDDIVIVDDVPEDLPTIIRTQRKKKHPTGVSRTKSVASKTSMYSTQTECTVLARTIAQKQEAITDSFAKIISELTTTQEDDNNEDEDDQANHKQIRSQVDATMLQQRELISQMQEIISRLETDARREEAENSKLKRKLSSAKKRLGGGPPSTTKSAMSLRGSKKSSPPQLPVSGGDIFPISEIFCTRPVDLDELTCLFNEPRRPRRLNDEVYEF